MTLLKPYSAYRSVWVEITKAAHDHGGPGWEFSTCLWCPSRDRGNSRRYDLMQQVWPGDLVLHFLKDIWSGTRSDTRLCGASLAVDLMQEVGTEPPNPGDWGGRPSYYRVDLRDYTPFPEPVPVARLKEWYGEEIRREITEIDPSYYPFATYGPTIRLTQGMYIARCTAHLYLILKEALGIEEAAVESEDPESELHAEYAEGLRASRERYFFTRNATLAKRAKERYGYTCQACGFQFRDTYGSLGERYIECHHLNPLSERSEREWTEGIKTSLDEVTVLCSNCHRMIHRQRPALKLARLKTLVERTRSGQQAS